MYNLTCGQSKHLTKHSFIKYLFIELESLAGRCHNENRTELDICCYKRSAHLS